MKAKNVLITVAVVAIGAAVVAANLLYHRETGLSVTTETIRARDLEAIVSASGKIQPKRLVNISADTAGRVVDLAVNEGDRVTRGQFLLQIDPQVAADAAWTAARRRSRRPRPRSTRCARPSRRRSVQLDQLRLVLKRQQELWNEQLTTREALEKAENDVKAAESGLQEREKQVDGQASRLDQERASLESARYDLSKVRIESPIDGIVTRRNIQEGETAMIGTMNNAGTVLLTLADMSVIQAEVEVDETNIPEVAIGQPAKITIDALPDTTFRGHVTRDREQPDPGVERRGRHAGDELQGGRGARRRGAGRASGVHVRGGHHDGDAIRRHVGADSRGGGARARL